MINAYAQDFVVNDELLLPILKTFAQDIRLLHVTRNARCFESVYNSFNLPWKKITLDKPEGRRRVGRPNLRWVDGVMKDTERLGVRNWKSKAKGRDGWRRLLESAKILHGL
jgi:hypothetical protein